MKKIYCGGQFQFQYKNYSDEYLCQDYRCKILKSLINFKHKPENEYIDLGNNTRYIGPFYFYENNETGQDIVRIESKMIENSTDCFFVLSRDSAPGTITEIIYATLLAKNIYIYYQNKPIEEGEPEREIQSDLWYSIEFCRLNCKGNVYIQGFNTYQECVDNCINRINKLIEVSF